MYCFSSEERQCCLLLPVHLQEVRALAVSVALTTMEFYVLGRVYIAMLGITT